MTEPKRSRVGESVGASTVYVGLAMVIEVIVASSPAELVESSPDTRPTIWRPARNSEKIIETQELSGLKCSLVKSSVLRGKYREEFLSAMGR